MGTSRWISQIIEDAPDHGFTTSEIARLVRVIATAKRSGRCYLYGTTYGDFKRDDGSRTTLHRAIHEALNGTLPDHLVVRHKCDTPPCVRPTHLESGTASENTRDAYERLRMAHINHPKGEGVSTALLSDEQVCQIRRLRRSGMSYSRIRELYPHVSYTTVRGAATGEHWSHVTEEPPCDITRRGPGTTRLRVDRSEVEPEARAAFEGGESLRSISRRTGVSTSTLTKWKRQWESAVAA